MKSDKEIRWAGSSFADLLKFPAPMRREAGFQLGKVQEGQEPENWKPFDEVGAGTKEIRIRDAAGIYRALYVAKFDDAIYVLHCFQKKTEETAKHDKDITAIRYKEIIQKRKVNK